MKFPVLRLSFVIELTRVIYFAWDLGSRSYITLYFFAKAVEETITCASILPFSGLSRSLSYVYILTLTCSMR